MAGNTRRAGRATQRLLERELSILAREIALTRDLLPLIARQRDGAWSAHEKAQLRAHLWRISRVSCYAVLIMLPGSFVALPLIAVWREQRRNRASRAVPAAAADA
jgi:hypothetical protein